MQMLPVLIARGEVKGKMTEECSIQLPELKPQIGRGEGIAVPIELRMRSHCSSPEARLRTQCAQTRSHCSLSKARFQAQHAPN